MARNLDLGAIQRGLKNEKTLLQERLKSTPLNPNADDTDSDLLDRAQDYESRERRYLLRRQVKRQLALVASALSRLDAGIYGQCTRCGKTINPQGCWFCRQDPGVWIVRHNRPKSCVKHNR